MMRVFGLPAFRLLLATGAWGLSFPTAKALMFMQASLVPGKPDWFNAAFVLWNRMILATFLMGVIYRRRLAMIRRSEFTQGVELGLFGGVGMLLQTDAQNYIAASTSAFFTQFTCVFVPLLVAFRARSVPPPRVFAATVLVMTGCGLLNGAAQGDWLFGRGEWETILAAAFFTGQILCLERPRYRQNEMRSVATIMFAVKAMLFLPVALVGATAGARGFELTGPGFVEVARCFTTLYSSPSIWLAVMILTLFSTIYGYATMTRWQPLVSSVQAGLIYATEPVFATLWALFLPGLFSWMGSIEYPNETLGPGFVRGALMVLSANAVILLGRRTP